MADARRRVMWLLNHSTARKFEVPMLKKLGFTEVFLPKTYPQEIDFRSASVDSSEDASLTIPAEDLAVLNEADWYSGPDKDTWEVANRHFDVLFFIAWGQSLLRSVARNFRGAAILRAYGLSEGTTYGKLIDLATARTRTLENLGRRFWLGTGYDHLADIEPPWLQAREVYLPVGLQDCRVQDDWTGTDPTIFFVCPDVATNPYYKDVYQTFKKQFEGFAYKVGGAQSLSSLDPHLLGFVSDPQHQRNMRDFRVMFYHSTEPYHIHYTPFEAVRAGMPLVFMGGGLLDRLGGDGLPGRCQNYGEARRKLRRILDGDRKLIDQIRTSQTRLLDMLRPEALESIWRRGMTRVLSDLDRARVPRPPSSRRRRIAVMLPAAYRGGTLRSAKLLAQALWLGSRQAGEDADVVFGYPDEGDAASGPWDSDLPPEIARRTLQWRELDPDTAYRAMRFAGNRNWEPAGLRYLAPDDGIHQMCDCDLWIVISDRLSATLLPLRPHLMVVYDYVQRYRSELLPDEESILLGAARNAERVLVTTRFTEQDALIYAGVPRERVVRVPMLVPEFLPATCGAVDGGEPYFLWTTNLGLHKNHVNAMTALRQYYELLDGRIECRVSGVGSDALLHSDLPHLRSLAALTAESEALRSRLRILGEVPEASYRRHLSGSLFLWHPARIDNGSLSVVEAALLGVPSLSTKYPAMEEMEATFALGLTWMDSQRPDDMAHQLKWMEQHAACARTQLPQRQDLAQHSLDRVAGDYWKVARECL